MKHMKITVEFAGQPTEEVSKKSKDKSVKSLSDLKKLFEEEDPDLSYGEMQVGERPMQNDITKGRKEGIQKMTPDDMAEGEDKETRTKNSKYPTIVGKKMA